MDSDNDWTVDVEQPDTYDLNDKEEPDTLGAKMWSSYHKVNPKKHSEITKHHYFLFVRHIYGFALKEKLWSRLNPASDRFQS